MFFEILHTSGHVDLELSVLVLIRALLVVVTEFVTVSLDEYASHRNN